jgi:hypothetical protein
LAYQVTPSQKRFNDPFAQKLYQFNTPRSNIYLSNPVNVFSEIIGNNIVTNGLAVDSISLNSGLVTVTITEGTCLIDNVFHKITSPTTLSLDVSGYDLPNGKIIVTAHYLFYRTTQINPLKLRLSYITNQTGVVYPVPLNIGNLVVVSVFTYDSENDVLNQLDVGESVIINGKEYLVRGYRKDSLTNMSEFIRNISVTAVMSDDNELNADFGEY